MYSSPGGLFYDLIFQFPSHDIGYLRDKLHGYLLLSLRVRMPVGAEVGRVVDDFQHGLSYVYMLVVAHSVSQFLESRLQIGAC